MTLSLLTTTAAIDQLQRRLGATPETPEGLCAALRAEVHARGHAPRAVTLDRVRRLLRPACDIDEERLAASCDALEREGDLILAPGGVLWATPPRAVPLLNGSARLFTSLPTPALATALGRAPVAQGAARRVEWDTRLEGAITAIGGRVVSPETWAGLHRAPPADGAFLSHLDERLVWESCPPGSLERDGPLDWRGWAPEGVRPGWRRGLSDARLWWAKTSFGGHRRVWTAGGGSPATAPFVDLSSDDADRARFALSRLTSATATAVVEHVGDSALVELPKWLPRPEYRWLSLQAEAAGERAGNACWRLPSAAVDHVLQLLANRLGVLERGR
ncbi:MAG: hypothetical protein IPG45_00065 [Deltaproteobacteria bacterium]|nr:hypothetical protein [Deltaproteobacteria bacterium]